ncbi:MAG TPA: 16S rRNA (cytosine(967)-C(5))-methyltransferase RsmB [Steroidobacteraceae bacterium]|nr:16S rRNA (cytosine(967)-C(5))-methyltransferase RsmB [Steroidobacteraceae bacterium]
MAVTEEGSTGAASRAAAARVVHAVVDGGRNLDRALDEARSGLPQRAHAELQAWTYGSLRWWPRIERQLAALSARPLAELDRLPLALLGVALFQIQHSPIPAHAIVDESVAATRLIDAARASGFVNAVLRRYLRERPAIDARVLKHPVGRYAHPRWLIEMLQDDWPEDFQHILDAGNEHPPLWLRVNARRQPVAAFEETLVAAGLSAEPSPFVPGALKLSAAVAVDAIPGFAAGAVSVQDAGAQLAALLLDLQAGQRVLDACAAPGGKTGHIAEAAPGLAELVAIDNDPDRVALIRENLERLGLTASLAAADAAQPRDWWDGRPFDRILLDVPCSATGVIRRHPDIKVLRRRADIAAFARQQSTLLASLWPLLVPGGRLVYASCSMLRAENSAVIGDFAGRHADARIVRPLAVPAGLGRTRGTEPGLYLIVGEAGTDGFYYACLEKTTTTV